MNNLKEYILEKFKISKDTNIKEWGLIDNYSIGDICIMLTHKKVSQNSSLHDYIFFDIVKILKINKSTIILDEFIDLGTGKGTTLFRQDVPQPKEVKYLVSNIADTQISILINQNDVHRVFEYIKENRELNFLKLLNSGILDKSENSDSIYKYWPVSYGKSNRKGLGEKDFKNIEEAIKEIKK